MAANNTDDLTNYKLAYQQVLTHIKQLEAMNKTLATEIDRQRKVVSAAQVWTRNDKGFTRIALRTAVINYEGQVAQLAKGEGG